MNDPSDNTVVSHTTDTHYIHLAGSNDTGFFYSGACTPPGQEFCSPSTDLDYLPVTSGFYATDDAILLTLPLGPSMLAFSDFQSNTPARSWQRALLEPQLRIDEQRLSMELADVATPLSVSVSLPLASPVAEPVPYARQLRQTGGSFASVQGDRAVLHEDVSVLQLQDLCHIESACSSLGDLAYPSPGIPRDDDLVALVRISTPSDHNMYYERPSADLLTQSCSPPSSIPSLSYDSISAAQSGSGSESNIPKTLVGTSFGDLTYPSFSPICKTDDGGIRPPAALGIYTDFNLREQAWQDIGSPPCVNPADVMTDSLKPWDPSNWAQSGPPTPSDVVHLSPALPVKVLSAAPAFESTSATPRTPSAALSPTPNHSADFPDESLIDQDFPQEAISAIVSVLKASNVKEEVQEHSDSLALSPWSFVRSHEIIAPQPMYPSHSRRCTGNDLASVAEIPYTPGLASQSARRVPFAELRLPQLQCTVSPYAYTPTVDFTHANHSPFSQPQTPPSHAAEPSSPVLNAHLGISLDELRRRAADYRQRNEGAELDKSFLQCFAGRLSVRGELQEDHRCYVVGCEQRNKRRDHILVHVGSHVEHRPWACQHCGMRFLRKNECKRHESSHEGRKPYSCHVCAPFQNKSFVRQDLLKRHLRITHGVHDTNGRRRTVKKDHDTADYWP